MADVSRAGLPSSSSKHVYDGVLGSSKVKSSRLSSFNDDDYGEIFGCSKLDNGGWKSSCCSIPVVELPVSEQRVRGVRGIDMDYGGVLGGFSDEGLCLMNGDELFDQLKKKARTSPPLVSVPSAGSKEQKKEVTGYGIPTHSQNVQQPSMDGISALSDDVKYYKQKINDLPSDKTNGTRHVGHSRSTSGPTSTSHEDAPIQEVQNARTSVVKADAQFDNDMPIRETHSRNSSSDLGVNKRETEHDAGFQKAPVLRELNSAAASNDTLQFTNQMHGASYDVDSSNKAPISETRVIQADTDFEVDINLATGGKHSRNSSPNIGVNELKSELDASFKKVHDLSGSNSAATSYTAQPCTVADEADVKFDNENDFGADGFSNSGPMKQNSEAHSASYQESGMSSSSSVAFDSGKKLGRHSRMTSLDLGRQAYDHDAGGFHRKSRLGSSYSFDASHDPSVAQIKVQPSKVIPSSSQPHFFPMESHCKISENSKSSSPFPSLDDQLDMNSLAAISASALQRAIEEADMQIRLAKEFLEREGQGCIKLRFKDTLKAKVMKENMHVNKINYVKKKKNMVEDCSQVDDVTITSPFGRDRVLETARFVPVVEDHKKFLKESIKGENAKASEFIENGDKSEAGEWEATKHLNQLITGVKNRLASFMTWQVETEKKEESKEVDSIIKQPHSTDGGCELKETVENESVIITANKKVIEENVTGVVPSYTEHEESGSTRSYTVGQEKVGGMIDSTLDTEGPIKTNFLFFTFNSGSLQGLPHPKQTEKNESQGSVEIEIENRQKLVDMVMNEQILRKGDEANMEVQDNSVSQDYGERLINSIYEECIATIKEHYPMASHDTNEFTHEENIDCELSQEANVIGKEEYADDCAVDEGHRNNHVIYEEHGADGIESTDEEVASDKRVIEESEDDRSASILEAINDTKVNEECESDTDASFHEADDTRVNEECGDDTYTSFHEADNDTRLNEEYTSVHDEGYDRTVCEEHGDDRSRSADEVENRKLTEEHGEELMDNVQLLEDIVHIVEDDNDKDEIGVFEESEDQPDNAELLQKIARASEERSKSHVNEWDQSTIYHIEEVSGQMNEVEEDHGYQSQADHVEETTKKEVEQASCTAVVDKCWQMEDDVLSKAEEATCRIDGSDVGAETEFAVENEIMEKNEFPCDVKIGVEIPSPFDKETEEKMEFTNHSSEPDIITDCPASSHTAVDCLEEKRGLASAFTENAMDFDGIGRHYGVDAVYENPILSECQTDVNSGPIDVADGKEAENAVELDEIEHHDIIDSTFQCKDSVPHECVTDVDSGQNNVIDGKETDLKPEDNFANETIHLHETGKTLDVGDTASISDQEAEKCNVHRRRRWFENLEIVGTVERPVVCEGSVTNLVVDQDVLEETDVAGSVEIHADEVDSETAEVNIGQADTVLNQGDGHANVETTHKRRRWFVKRGEEGLPQSPSLFAGINVTSELDHGVVNGSTPHYKSDECLAKSNSEVEVVSGEKDKQNVEATPRRKRWFESVENVEPAKNLIHEDNRMTGKVDQEHEEGTSMGKHQNLDDICTVEGMNDVPNKVEPVNESHRDMDAENKRKKEKERLTVERIIREARERAFAEAKERARRDATERPNRVTSQKSTSGEANSSSDKASIEMKIRAERAAVERATAEVRERAMQKALSEKASQRSGRHPPERSSSLDPKYSSSSYLRSSDPSNNGDKFNEADGESAQRREARLERQNRTMERAAKALEEKNKRDILVQKEQAARNMLADALDAEVKRWSTGKEGNVRALLSTLQYILGSDSGWQAVSLTDLVAPTAVRKAYKKATLCVHPDKLQQRGATIQQKYICEKVFDLLKDAWSRFNPDER